MKKALIATLTGIVVVAAAYGDLGSVVGSFRVCNHCAGLAISSACLYINDYNARYVYRVHPTTGSIFGSFNVVNNSYTRGLAFDGNYLWVNKVISDPYLTYRVNAASGSIYASYAIPSSQTEGVAPRASGDYGAGTDALFHFCRWREMVYLMNLSGSITSSYRVSSECDMYDIAYDWRNRLIWGGRDPVGSVVPIWGTNTSGSLVASFTVANMINNYGITYAGSYLWAAGQTGWVYRIHCPVGVGVQPASVGRVKALFR